MTTSSMTARHVAKLSQTGSVSTNDEFIRGFHTHLTGSGSNTTPLTVVGREIWQELRDTIMLAICWTSVPRWHLLWLQQQFFPEKLYSIHARLSTKARVRLFGIFFLWGGCPQQRQYVMITEPPKRQVSGPEGPQEEWGIGSATSITWSVPGHRHEWRMITRYKELG